ncbi:MAG: hypothetical protein BBJ57_01180 [Desulfobacterales bacterium PC51MH44]|nr:MAG: hypothetical protein BBJ57_01180 [Desulfobacterales bacterium PC51MH44]
MNLKALEYYRCNCGSTLKILGANQSTDDSEILEARLYCDKCGSCWPIKHGIPRFVPERSYADSFGYQWNIHAKTQLDSYTGLPISRNRLFGVTGWPQHMEGQKILEAGSGAGRFTEVLLGTGAEIFSFDFSSAVEANWANNGHCPNLNLFQGDIFNIPLRERSFDKVLCLGVIQHTPDPEKAFRSLSRYVRPGGELVIDVYAKSALRLLRWQYVLRPITRRMNKERLYRLVSRIVPILLPCAISLRRLLGTLGSRLLPIAEYSQLGLQRELNREWAILDTFDIYSPAHDHPRSLQTIRWYFREADFVDVTVKYGPNGIVGRGRRPVLA